MTEMEETERQHVTNPTRRRLLRRGLTAGVATGFGLEAASGNTMASSCSIGADSGTYSEINYEWKDEDSISEVNVPSGSGTEYAIETQSSVIHAESSYSTADGRWTHFFYEGAHLVSHNKASWESDSAYELHRNISNHKVTLDNRDPNQTSMFVTDNSYDVGAVPSPNGSTDNGFGDAAWTAMKFALAVESTAFAVGTVAAEIAHQLLNNGENDSGSIQEYAWPYTSSFPCEAAHYCHWLIRGHDDYAQANVKVYEYAVADAGNVNNSMTWTLHVDPFNGGIQSVDGSTGTQSTIPEPGTGEYVEMLEASEKFRRVPYDSIERPLLRDVADGQAVYRAIDPAVEIRSGPGAPDEYSPEPAT